MIYYYFYDKQGYDHIRVNGDGIFRPEIVRAVNSINYQVEQHKNSDEKVKNKLAEVLQEERRREEKLRSGNIK